MTASTAPPQIKPSDLITEYIWLRDNKEAEEKRFTQFVKDNYSTRMKEIEHELLQFLNQTGGQNFGNEQTGLVYRITKYSAAIADALTFRRHVIGTQNWDLADWKANITSVKEMVKRGENPAEIGLNYTEYDTVGIQKKKAKG